MRRPSERGVAVASLGVVEILAFGSTYYLLTILAGPVAADTGWPPAAVAGGLSLALLASGLLAPRVGRLIGREGGRRVMTGGLLLTAAGLAAMAAASSVWAWLGAWALVGAGMAATLYEAAFGTLGQLYRRDARGAITALTLWGGFASTACWPLSALLLEAVGWRGTCLAYAALHLAVALPLVRLGVPRPVPRPADAAPDAPPPPADLAFWCIAVAGVCLVGAFTALAVHLVALLAATGRGLEAAVALGALIGPAQVGARVLEMARRGRHHPVATMLVATALSGLGMAGLASGVGAAGMIALGAGNGLWSIVKGALPLALWPPESYPAIVGRLALPMLLSSAAAPLLGAALIAGLGPEAALRVLALVAAVPFLAALVLAACLRRGAGRPR